MNRKLTPYYHHLLRKEDFYFLLSSYVGVQDLINNELNGKGDMVEGNLRQILRRKCLANNPIVYGTNIVPLKNLLEDRHRQMDPVVRASLSRNGIALGPNQPTKAKPKSTPVKSFEPKKGKLALEEDNDAAESVKPLRPLTLQEQILNCLAGKGLDCIDEVSDFLARNTGSVPTPFNLAPRLS